ncbi:M48 family metallopeptidase [Streptosporangium sp. CA-135522]|uniref:M48 family metallopeptidase n=1 Tax=Streptosporangium sp. CA-135522 TaxID=3240072 RepID=UPI003D94A5D1
MTRTTTGTPPGIRAAGWALAALGAVTLAVVAFTTPWRALPPTAPPVVPDPARDFTPDQIARSESFDAVLSAPAYLSLGLTLVAAGILVSTPLGARLVGRLRGPWWLRVLLGVLVLSVAVEILRWPLGMWSEIHLREFGLSTQDWPAWSADRIKNIGIRTGLIAIMVLAVVALARRYRRWWIPAAVGAFALTMVASFAYPVLIEPLFNDFTPLPAGQLRDDLLTMASRDGVPVEDVLVADASRRTTTLNAYVSGLGATRRIVVYDTLLKAPADEVELVVAHELGHAKADDVLYGTLVGGLGAACGACLLYLATSWQPLRRRTGIASAADPKAVGLIMGLLSLTAVLSSPAQNLVSRHIEARADAHALDLTRDPVAFTAMQKRLSVTNISDLSPDAFEYALYVSHPTAPQRIAMARSWALLNGMREP